MKTPILLQLTLLALAHAARAAMAPAELVNSLVQSDPNFQVAERGQDFALLRKIASRTDAAGITTSSTNQVTLLENGLHYFADGEWKPSEDLIEPFPGGAVARRGPHKTIFSPDLNAEAVFDIQTAEGQRIRGGVRSIQLTDIASGKILVLATVKNAAPGVVVPPNQVLYASGFDGLDADVLFVWRHNTISQNVILKKRPALPEGMDPATTRLEVVSELVECPDPVLNSAVLKQPGKPDLRDDVTIGLGSLVALRGKAFPVAGTKGLMLTGEHLMNEDGVSVVKQFYQLEDGRKFIIESVGWPEIEPLMKDLAAIEKPDAGRKPQTQLAAARAWPKCPSQVKGEPMQMAGLPYKPTGFLVDIDLSGSVLSYTFLSGTTYYIAQSFLIYGTSTTTFQPGCVIKYGADAWLLFGCPVAFPPKGQVMPVLTSRDDDLFGSMIPGSTHNPYYSARPALWVYYGGQPQTLIRNLRIRWAKKGIEYDAYSGVEVVHNLSDTLFQNCLTNVYADMPDGELYLNNVTYCIATMTLAGSYGYLSGSMTKDCGPLYTVANFAGIKQQEDNLNPPDTMGAVCPSHFMIILNGAVAVHDKFTGVRRSPTPPTSLSSFFSLTVNSGLYQGTYPTASPFDPRVLYDHGSQRWIACAVDGFGSKHVLLAVSKTSDPIGNGGSSWVGDNWTKYLVPVGPCDPHQDSLGVDSNGIYISVQIGGGGCGALVKIAALPKAPFISGAAEPVQSNFILDVPNFGAPLITPAINFDPVTTDDPAWFITLPGPSSLYYNRLKWVHGFTAAPEWELPWSVLTIPQSYYDLLGGGISAPQLGSPGRVALYIQGGGLMNTVVRKIDNIQYLWTCHQIGVNSAGNNDNPPAGTGPADRSAVEWFKIQTTPSVNIASSGRIYDTAGTSPKFYYMPSLTVNRNGDMAIGFSGSSANEYISAYYSGRLNNGMSPIPPVRYGPGLDFFNASPYFRWGDYSYTSLDPDGLTMWTIQQYAEARFNSTEFIAWGTWIGATTPF